MAGIVPVWCYRTASPGWHTRKLEDTDLRVVLNIHTGWSQRPTRINNPLDVEHRYAGRTPDEWLILNRMPDADPTADMTHWVNLFIAATGFPIIGLASHPDYQPNLLEWQEFEVAESLSKTLDVDEVHLFEGVGRIPEVMRIYIMLARRGTIAWKVTLTLASACLPGTDFQVITLNDHVRAGTTFGSLKFL
jgi:hypothetical protein